ncbi:MAG: sortase [Eubacterium sp.]|nr:sortase [Eubacterium sp.]
MEKRRRKRGILFLVLGIVLISLAGGWYLVNLREDKSAGQQAEALLDEVNEQLRQQQQNSEQAEDTDPALVVAEEAFCGKILIGKLGVELPVYQDWTYEKLKKSPCRYAGSVLTDDMIIAAHNYKSHFGNLKELEVNDSIIFVDAKGTAHNYVVKAITTLDGTAVEDMVSGEWDFTLFTCTRGGEQRVTVRCDRAIGEVIR